MGKIGDAVEKKTLLGQWLLFDGVGWDLPRANEKN